MIKFRSIIQFGESEGVEPSQVGTKYRLSHSEIIRAHSLRLYKPRLPTCPRISPTCLQHSARYDSSPVTSNKFITVFYTAAYFVSLFVNARNLKGR